MRAGLSRVAAITLPVLAGLLAGTAPLLAQEAGAVGGKLTYWGSLIFSDEANALLEQEARAWAKANGVDLEVVMINQNDTLQRVSAAVEAGTMPDVLDLDLPLLMSLSARNQFLPLDDLYAALGEAHGGWFDSIATTSDTTPVAGARTGIPFGASGNMLLRRTDVLEAAGFTEPPATWEELVAQAAAVTAPPLWGMGFAISSTGDANLQLNILQSFGGRLAGDDGRTIAIDSPETRAYLAWVKSAWDQGLFPPGVASWDGAGDNQAFLAGQAVFIANPGSVGIAARANDPELFATIGFSALPRGPVGVISPLYIVLRAIAAGSGNPEAAKALIAHLSSPDFARRYYAAAIYGPVLRDQRSFPIFDGSSEMHAGLLDLVERGTPPGYPDVFNLGFVEASNTLVVPRMVQRVLIDGWDFDRAIDEAEATLQAIYARYP